MMQHRRLGALPSSIPQYFAEIVERVGSGVIRADNPKKPSAVESRRIQHGMTKVESLNPHFGVE